MHDTHRRFCEDISGHREVPYLCATGWSAADERIKHDDTVQITCNTLTEKKQRDKYNNRNKELKRNILRANMTIHMNNRL